MVLGEGACTFLIFEKGGKDFFEWVFTTKSNLMRLPSQAYLRHKKHGPRGLCARGPLFSVLYMLERGISLIIHELPSNFFHFFSFLLIFGLWEGKHYGQNFKANNSIKNFKV